VSQIIANETKQEIINKIHEGMSVRDASTDYGISTKSIYRWLRDGLASSDRNLALENNRLRKENEQLYALLGEVAPGWVRHFACWFEIDRSAGYRKPTQLKQRDEQEITKLKIVHKDHPAYGYRRLALALAWSPNKTRRLMRASGVVPLALCKKQFVYNPQTAASDDTLPEEVRSNLLKQRNVTAQYPHHIWAEDFTYLKYKNKMYYLATVLDLCTRQIVGWALSAHHDTQLIQEALLDATSKHQPPAILHNDQGSEYCSKRYYALCGSLEIELSFSAKGSPWQNGFQESFYREFKLELDTKQLNRFNDLGELAEAIARQLHYYNTSRIHTALRTNPAAYAAGFEQDTIKSRLSIHQITTEVRDRVLRGVGA